jgi:hypothetical protein
MNRILIFIFFCLSSININAFAASEMLKEIKPDRNAVYVVRLNNGDIITGSYIEFVNDPDEGEGVKLRTELGNAIIFANQIIEIRASENLYRHSHRAYILPTAEPIGSNHFIGVWEMLFLYAGAGIGDIVSITAGRSVVPGISSSQQATDINIKATLASMEFESTGRLLTLALGVNYSLVNDANKMIHLYGVGTFSFSRTSLTIATFYKLGSQDFFTAYFGNNAIDVVYPDGAFGIGLGLDSKWSTRHDLHIIGELWNSDVAHPSHTGVLLGLRLANSNFSSDFGLAFFTLPLVAPFVSFTWTPF